jgi:putative sigma-54 modulation protein
MQMHITGRHVEITDDIRSYVEKRVKKIEGVFNRIIDLQVVIELEKSRYFTEIMVATKKAMFHAQGETHDVFSSLDSGMDKLDRQIRRYKERMKDWRHRTPQRDVAAQLSEEGISAQEDTGVSLDSRPPIVRASEKFAPKPMTVEEAAMQLEMSGDSLLLFLNAETNQINLVYEQENRNYGWVEPQF